MTYKTIMVHVGSDDRAAERLGAALALGHRFGSTIVGVGSATWDTYVDPVLGLGDGETIALLRSQTETDIAAAASLFQSLTKGYPHPVVWKADVDYPAMTMIRSAGGADLIVASRRRTVGDHRQFPHATDLIMESGVPVLLLSSSGASPAGAKIMVGWKNTRETRRAVTDALPLLRAAERVYLVQVAERGVSALSADAELQDVVGRLQRHGVFAEASVTPQLGETVVDDLMAVAASRGCDLSVFGAYGHSRVREWAFGGVTSDILDQGPVGVLFSR